MSINTKPPRLRTGAARKYDHVGTLIDPSNTTSPTSIQDIAAAIIAERFRLSPCLARVVIELASIGGRLS